MSKFTKKPVTVEAIQWTGDNFVLIDEFITCVHETYPLDGTVKIHTLEGVMTADKNDWIIKGVNGEFYPCKPDIFAKTYNPFSDEDNEIIKRMAEIEIECEKSKITESEENLTVTVKAPIRELEIGTKRFTKVIVHDKQGAGGACHKYTVEKIGEGYSPSLAIVNFQNGPIKENGVNGCHNEDLIAIVIDRLECFQAGEFACPENERAIIYLKESLGQLNFRTQNRIVRGVEGTSIK